MQARTSILESLGQQGVTVNPDKLTDINLLKRHVLKRCIYGVDLNPMAVELAKVSLWLDAFTLGAPLSFLDHHLRCGNSLVGATMADLQKAKSSLFALNYEPLLRAINHVLFVSNLSDATASEVSSSAMQYDLARKSLSGYKVILDLIVAGHFGLPNAAELVKFGIEYNLSDHDSFIASLHDDKDRKLVKQVEDLANRPDRRFFHWEIEFPEIFFGFADEQHRQIQHKNKIVSGSAGFDCVVGNPPYINAMELSRSVEAYDKAYWKHSFEAAKGAYDIYVLFIEKCLKLLACNRLTGLITPNKFLSAPYAVALRNLLTTDLSILRLWDVSRVPVFDDPSVYTVVSICTNQPTTDMTPLIVEQSFGEIDSRRTFSHCRTLIKLLPDRILGFLLSNGIDILLKILDGTRRFDELCAINASTTASEAEAYGGAMTENSKFKGNAAPAGWAVVNTGLIDRYQFLWGQRSLTDSGKQYEHPWLPRKGNIVSVNRSGQYDKPKLVFSKMVKSLEVAFDENGKFAALNVNFVFCEGDEGFYYLGIVNSKFMTWVYSQYFGALRMSGGYFQVQAPQIRVLPIIPYDTRRNDPTTQELIALARRLAANDRPDTILDAAIDKCVYLLYGVSEEEILIIEASTDA